MSGKSPDAFRTISEVAEWLGVNAHVLRFWESKFSQVKPVKRAGGRRYYRPSDMELLGGIQKLLHEDGMTIKGVQKVLRERGVKAVCAMSKPVDGGEVAEPEPPVSTEKPAFSDSATPSSRTEGAKPEPGLDRETEVGTEPAPDVRADTGPARDVTMPLFNRGVETPPAPVAVETNDDGADSAETETVAEDTPVAAEPATGPATGPVIAPLPGEALSIAERLARVPPGRIDPAALRPIHARLVALRARMDTAG
ncbi:MerR family transcriptional regulator [Tropicimonas marinistellae]|uniref:MerR family transcriptional regulator n=1 Tax=Tropicimonas marinistellae TaxID=1739787 RepID=UPI000AC867D1|nr:MerR family transcriptional regulator [Tropicimonas marinistellae]